MSTKLLTFLGLGNYQEVTYCWNRHEYKTRLFPEALAKWLEPAEILVLLTTEAKAGQHWKDLQQRLSDLQLVPPQPINIPSGKSEKELWEIFTILTGCLDGQRPVVFDVTHAFRSLPILALLATAYLRVAHTVRLERLLYGAFEARVNDRAPVFDLTPFVALLDWVTATDQFLRTGSAEALAGLLPDTEPTKALSENVRAIAQGLHLLRPMDVMREAAALPERIHEAAPVVSTAVPPFASLTQRVQDGYGAFGLLNAPDFAHNSKAALMRQLRMAQWYADKGQFVHALSVAREWLPSLLCSHFNLDPMEEKHRTEMEWLLNRGGIDKDVSGTILKESSYRADWQNLSGRKRLARLWGDPTNLSKLRNDVLHAGFRKNPKSTQEIAHITTEIIAELKAIAAEWRLEDETA